MKKILITNEKTKQQYALIISDYEELIFSDINSYIKDYKRLYMELTKELEQ